MLLGQSTRWKHVLWGRRLRWYCSRSSKKPQWRGMSNSYANTKHTGCSINKFLLWGVQAHTYNAAEVPVPAPCLPGLLFFVGPVRTIYHALSIRILLDQPRALTNSFRVFESTPRCFVVSIEILWTQPSVPEIWQPCFRPPLRILWTIRANQE